MKHGATLQFNYPNNVKGSFVALFPQLDGQYVDWQPFYIDEMITWARANLNIDTNRVFITGYSLGGGGTWVYPAASLAAAKRVAGVIPISGSGLLPSGDPCNIAKGGVAVWAIHTNDDDQIPTSVTSDIVNAIKACSPIEPVLGWYPKGNHQIYDQQIYPDFANKYTYPSIYQWMLRVNRKNTYQNNQAPVANVGAIDTTVVVNSNMMFFQKQITGVLSQDPNDIIMRYNWQIISNNLTKVFPYNGYQPADTSTVWPGDNLDYKNWSWPWQNLEFHALGDYVFKLTVTDMFGAASTQTKTIHIINNGINTAPVINLGNDITLATGVTTASFIGTKVFDWEGQTMTYKVTQEAGPKTAKLNVSNWYQFTVSDMTLAGTYVFKVTATDAGGAVGTDIVNVVKLPDGGANIAPIARITGDSTIALPVSSTTLDGSASTDSDGTIAAYAWMQTTGPNTATIVSPSGKSTAINNLIAGTYRFQLKVTDNKSATGTAVVTVIVNAAGNILPVAKITGATNITLPVNSVTLDGSTSTDSDGTISAYAWTQTTGPNTATIVSPSGKSTVINNLVAGTYTFQLKVTDDKSATAISSVSVTVSSSSTNKLPIANAGNDFSTTNGYAYLSAGASYDPDGNIAAYSWSQMSGPSTAIILSGNTMFPTVQDLKTGIYIFRVTVTDNMGASAFDDVQLTVGGNKPPVANAGNDIITGEYVTNLSAAASTDVDGSIAAYKWTQVSGPNTATILNGITVSPTVQNLITGTYVFRVTVTDNLGANAFDDVSVTVSSASTNKLPIANAGNDFSTTNSYAYLSAGASYDPAGKITAYNWSQINGPNSAVILYGTTMFPIVQGLITGTYIFRLKVTDNSGASVTDDVVLIVTAKAQIAMDGKAIQANETTAKELLVEAINLYPNPAASNITISFSNNYIGSYKVIVYDVNGKVEKQGDFIKFAEGLENQRLDISKLPVGLHYVKIIYKRNQHSLVQKFIKQ